MKKTLSWSLAFILSSFALSSAQGIRLNGSLASTSVTGDVEQLLTSPDGLWVAYLADPDVADQLELFSARVDGTGSVHALSGALVAGGSVQRFAFTPDSARVVYLADEDTNDVYELFSAPVDGSGATVKLSGPMVAGGSVVLDSNPWPMTSDGQTILYRSDEDFDGQVRLYAAPTDGAFPSSPLWVSGPEVERALLAADNATVVFSGSLVSDPTARLFKVPLSGGAPVRVNGTLTVGTSLTLFELAPDASRVVYMADQGATGKVELFSRRLDLSAPAVVLSGVLGSDRDVFSFSIASTSQRVVYQANRDVLSTREVYSVPLDGSLAPVELNHAGATPTTYLVSPNGGRVAYRTANQLYSAPIDGSAGAVQLFPALAVNSQWGFSPDSERVLAVDRDLFSQPANGSAAAIQLNPSVPQPETVQGFVVAPDSSRALYLVGNSSAARLLFSVPIDGSATPTQLEFGPPWQIVFQDLAIDATSSVALYRSDVTRFGVVELRAVPLDGSAPAVALNAPMPETSVMGEVTSFSVSPDGKWAVYADDNGFHSASLRSRGPAHRLLPAGLRRGGGASITFLSQAGFAPDSRHVYLALATESAALLYRARLDGSEPASLVQRVNGSSFSSSPATNFNNLRFTPDGARLVYEKSTFNYSGPPNFGELYSVPTDGSAPPVTLTAGSSIGGFALSADSTRVAYWQAGSDFTEAPLESVLVDGSDAPISLLPPGREYRSRFEATPDGTRVVFGARDSFSGPNPGFYCAPIDASQPPTLLASGIVDLSHVNPATLHVAYVVVNGSNRELRHGPLDASAPSTLLASVPTSRQLKDFVFSPDGTRIVYHANAASSSRFELFVVPVDGSLPAALVNGPLVAGGNVTAPDFSGTPHFAVTPDGARVVYAADARVNDIFELWSAPAAGGGAATLLNNPLPPGLKVHPDFHILSNSTDILYRGNPSSGFLPLWRARTDRLGPFTLLSGPLAGPSTTEAGFVVTRGERYVVYRSDHANPGTTELWASPLDKIRSR